MDESDKKVYYLFSCFIDCFQYTLSVVQCSNAQPLEISIRQQKDLSGCSEALSDEIIRITSHANCFKPFVDCLHDGVVKVIVSTKPLVTVPYYQYY